MTNDKHHEIIHAADGMIDMIKNKIEHEPGEEMEIDTFMDPDTPGYLCWFLGSLLGFSPSGKYYTPWTTNQDPEDIIMDELFWDRVHETLDRELPDYWLEHGEGDPLDVFVVTRKKDEEEGEGQDTDTETEGNPS